MSYRLVDFSAYPLRQITPAQRPARVDYAHAKRQFDSPHVRLSCNGTSRFGSCQTWLNAACPTRPNKVIFLSRPLLVWCLADQQITIIRGVLPAHNAPSCGALPPCRLHALATHKSSRSVTQYATGSLPNTRLFYWCPAKLCSLRFDDWLAHYDNIASSQRLASTYPGAPTTVTVTPPQHAPCRYYPCL